MKLVIYFGERDRTEGGFVADELVDIFERHTMAASILMRGVEGFGMKHQLRTDRLLTLSEDLPIVAIAIDEQQEVEAVLAEIREIAFDGLITLERARLLDTESDRLRVPEGLEETAKLTIYLGRGERLNGRVAYEFAVQLLHDRGLDGASVLIGVDGMLGGARQRARFFGRNRHVPAMVISVGSTELLADAAAELGSLLKPAVITLERVQVLKRDGQRLASLPAVEGRDEAGRARWQKLMLYSSEQNHAAGRPAHQEAIRRLRAAEAAGATALRGIWGYHGDHAPHGDSALSIRRRVPTLTVVVDAPEKANEWMAVLDEVSPERGLITSEVVPALQARTAEKVHGGLGLAERWRAR